MNNSDHISGSLETTFWVKILKFFDADPGSGDTFTSIHCGRKTIHIKVHGPALSDTNADRFPLNGFIRYKCRSVSFMILYTDPGFQRKRTRILGLSMHKYAEHMELSLNFWLEADKVEKFLFLTSS
jgi:hypothetical protein